MADNAQDQRNAENNAKNIKLAANVAVKYGEGYGKVIGGAVLAADKVTGGKSTEFLGKGMNAANKTAPMGDKIQNASNKFAESGAADAGNKIMSVQNGDAKGAAGDAAKEAAANQAKETAANQAKESASSQAKDSLSNQSSNNNGALIEHRQDDHHMETTAEGKEGFGDKYEKKMDDIGTKQLSKNTGLDEGTVGKGVQRNKKNRFFNPTKKYQDKAKDRLNNLSKNRQGNRNIPKNQPATGDAKTDKKLAKQERRAERKEKVKKAIKKYNFIKIFLAILPAIVTILQAIAIFIIVAFVILVPVYLICAFANEVLDFGDGFTNFLAGEGFQKSSEVVQTKLKKAQENYEKDDCGAPGNCFEGKFDKAILASTIQLNNIMNVDVYDVTEAEAGGSDYSVDEAIQTIDGEKSRSFYYVQNTLLGSPEISGYVTLGPNERKLIFYLVDYQVGWTCTTSSWDQITSYVEVITETIGLASQRSSVPSINLFALIKEIFSMNKEGFDFLQYALDNGFFNDTETEKKDAFLRVFSQPVGQCGIVREGDKEIQTHPKPYLRRYQNYSSYLKYVRDVIIPLEYYNCKTCTKVYTEAEKKNIVKNVFDDIVNQRNYYSETDGDGSFLIYEIDDDTGKITAYLIGGDGSSGGSGALRGDLASLILPAGSTGFNGVVHFYSQTDYKNYTYYADRSISRSGCGPTSLSIAISSLLGQEHDPVELVDQTCNKHNYCTARNGTKWAAMAAIPPVYGLKVETVSNNRNGIQKVVDALSTGNAIVISIMGPGHFTTGGHYITLTGVNSQGQIYVVDPNNGEKKGKNKWWDLNIIVSENRGSFWIITR